MTEVNVTITGELQKLALQPGDVLVLKLDGRIDSATCEQIKQRLSAIVGSDVPVLVLDEGVTPEVMKVDAFNEAVGKFATKEEVMALMVAQQNGTLDAIRRSGRYD